MSSNRDIGHTAVAVYTSLSGHGEYHQHAQAGMNKTYNCACLAEPTPCVHLCSVLLLRKDAEGDPRVTEPESGLHSSTTAGNAGQRVTHC
jgi:hypothetical protein